MLTPRFGSPRSIPRGVALTVDLPVYDGDDLATVTAGTYTLYKGTTVQITGSIDAPIGTSAEYTYGATDLDDLPYDVDYREEWALTIGGQVLTLTRDASIVRQVLYPVVTAQDLLRLHSDLSQIDEESEYLNQIDEAWCQIISRLIGSGSYPQLVTNSYAFRSAHLYLALSLVAVNLSTTETGNTGHWTSLVKKYEDRYDLEWSRITLEYDTNSDGSPDTTQAAVPVFFTSGPAQRRWY